MDKGGSPYILHPDPAVETTDLIRNMDHLLVYADASEAETVQPNAKKKGTRTAKAIQVPYQHFTHRRVAEQANEPVLGTGGHCPRL